MALNEPSKIIQTGYLSNLLLKIKNREGRFVPFSIFLFFIESIIQQNILNAI